MRRLYLLLFAMNIINKKHKGGIYAKNKDLLVFRDI